MKQIIAMGGGGFSMEPDNPLLDLYVLQQSGQKNPKVVFLPTASGDAEGYISNFYRSFGAYDCEPSHLSLFRVDTQDLESFILEKDVIYVGGGNTKSMLSLWREWGLDVILRKAWEQGIVLAGLSAGAICWFEEGLTDSYGHELMPLSALGFLKGSHSPHYDGESERRPAYQKYIKSGHLMPGYAADDGVGLHFIDQELHKVVSSRPNAKAYYVTTEGESLIERTIDPVYLRKGPNVTIR